SSSVGGHVPKTSCTRGGAGRVILRSLSPSRGPQIIPATAGDTPAPRAPERPLVPARHALRILHPQSPRPGQRRRAPSADRAKGSGCGLDPPGGRSLSESREGVTPASSVPRLTKPHPLHSHPEVAAWLRRNFPRGRTSRPSTARLGY